MDITPVEKHGDIWLKRDDLYTLAGVSGGKVRTCKAIIDKEMSDVRFMRNRAVIITAGSRSSPQVNIVARVAKHYPVPFECRVHVPCGKLSPEVQAAKDVGAIVFQHKPGYNSVIIARARKDAEKHGIYIPFGMECMEAVKQTAVQVSNLPLKEIKRIVVPVGSGMSLAGVLEGLMYYTNTIPVIGVSVGADPRKRLDKYAPAGWQAMTEIIQTGTDYHKPADGCHLDGVQLDPYYEAKCVPFLKSGDLLWVVGIRQTVGG